MSVDQLKPVLEAALLASQHALTLEQLAALYDDHERPTLEALGRALESLREDCAARGVELNEVASGFRYQVKPEIYTRINRLWTERQHRYTRATLETLALIAYRQPITRGEIEAIRGVSVSTSIIKSLEEREWIRVIGYRELPGRPALFGTTKTFLDYFALRGLDELPTLAELRDFTSAPELDFSGQRAGPFGGALSIGEPESSPESSPQASPLSSPLANPSRTAANSTAVALADDSDPSTPESAEMAQS